MVEEQEQPKWENAGRVECKSAIDVRGLSHGDGTTPS